MSETLLMVAPTLLGPKEVSLCLGGANPRTLDRLVKRGYLPPPLPRTPGHGNKRWWRRVDVEAAVAKLKASENV
jgi:hypothetical protein